MNRVENQNEPERPQSGGRLGSFWFSTRPSADTGTDYNIHHAHKITEALWALRALCASLVSVHGVVIISACVYRMPSWTPKWTQTAISGHHLVAVWVRLGVQLDSLEKTWSLWRHLLLYAKTVSTNKGCIRRLMSCFMCGLMSSRRHGSLYK